MLSTKLGDLLLKVFNRLPLPAYPYRMYMHRHQCIFIHIPKNAGSSILKSLGHKRGRDHVEWRHYRGANPRWFNQYYKFAICREPFDRLRSAYQYVIRGGNQSVGDLALMQYVKTNSSSLDEFVLNLLGCDFIHANVLFKPQYLFVYSPDGVLQVDILLHFESLNEEWNKLAEAQGYPNILTKTNSTSAGQAVQPAIDELSEPARQKVIQLYQQDFQYFNYKTDRS